MPWNGSEGLCSKGYGLPCLERSSRFMQHFEDIYSLTLTRADLWFERLSSSVATSASASSSVSASVSAATGASPSPSASAAEPEFCSPERMRGRVLARDISADRDIPPFHRVAVDGYACRREDLEGPLTLLGTVAAGEVSDLRVGSGTCVKVMTGGVLPEGGEIMVMVESTDIDSQGRVLFNGSEKEKKSTNISRRGEDVPAGEMILG